MSTDERARRSAPVSLLAATHLNGSNRPSWRCCLSVANVINDQSRSILDEVSVKCCVKRFNKSFEARQNVINNLFGFSRPSALSFAFVFSSEASALSAKSTSTALTFIYCHRKRFLGRSDSLETAKGRKRLEKMAKVFKVAPRINLKILKRDFLVNYALEEDV